MYTTAMGKAVDKALRLSAAAVSDACRELRGDAPEAVWAIVLGCQAQIVSLTGIWYDPQEVRLAILERM